MPLIEVSGLTKSYGPREVLHGLDLTVDAGEIVGVLGPNGSGKTTAVECIGGLRVRDGGTVNVSGMDPADDPLALREILGMQLQQCRLISNGTVGSGRSSGFSSTSNTVCRDPGRFWNGSALYASTRS